MLARNTPVTHLVYAAHPMCAHTVCILCMRVFSNFTGHRTPDTPGKLSESFAHLAAARHARAGSAFALATPG